MDFKKSLLDCSFQLFSFGSIWTENCCPWVRWIITHKGNGSVPALINSISVVSDTCQIGLKSKEMRKWMQAEKTSQYELGTTLQCIFFLLCLLAAILAPLDLWFTRVRRRFVNNTLREKLNYGSAFDNKSIVSLFVLASPLILLWRCFAGVVRNL